MSEAIYDPRSPDTNRRGGHIDADWQYPGAYCSASNACRSCARWRCTKCRKLRPWCVGGTGPHPGWCDDCWDRTHRRLRGRPCGVRGCDEHKLRATPLQREEPAK